MSALTSRQAARERLLRHVQMEVDRLLPADESVPLKGTTFLDFENIAEQASNDLYTVFLEECVALSGAAQARPTVGRCPYCSSPRIREIGEAQAAEVRTPRGVVVMSEQTFRCRDCSRSFSPSASGLVDGGGGGVESQGDGEGGA
jgi:DNA-directed RNA polymerase subunit RPC12/RpoP